MLNVVVPIAKDPQKFFEIIERLRKMDSIKILVGVCESDFQVTKNQFSENENVSVHAFQDGSDKEEILNALQLYIENGAIMILRKPITMSEFNKFISKRKDIVTCERNLSRFKSFLFRVWQKILKLFLGVRLYEGDPSIILLSEELSVVSVQSANLSYSTRVDRWKGIEQSTVQTSARGEKTTVNKRQNYQFLIFAVISLVLGVLVTTLVCLFTKLSIVLGLLIICFDIIAVAVALIMVIMFAFNHAVGNRKFERAFEFEKNENEE